MTTDTDRERALVEAARATALWLQDERLDTWPYMEGQGFYIDRDAHLATLQSALAQYQEPSE